MQADVRPLQVDGAVPGNRPPLQPDEQRQPAGDDRIVPPLAANVLADALPKAAVMAPPLGHIGMAVARGTPKAVWPKLAEWVRVQA